MKTRLNICFNLLAHKINLDLHIYKGEHTLFTPLRQQKLPQTIVLKKEKIVSEYENIVQE